MSIKESEPGKEPESVPVDEQSAQEDRASIDRDVASNEASPQEAVSESEAEATEAEPADRLRELEAEVAEHKDRYMRAAAELQNYKKRTSRQMDDMRRYANEALLRELLPVVDNLERALTISSDDDEAVKGIAEGVELTLKEILKVFEKFNVKPIEALEKPFDPNFHQAVSREERDGVPDNTIVSEFQKGYLIHDRLLRPAMVVVAMGKKD